MIAYTLDRLSLTIAFIALAKKYLSISDSLRDSAWPCKRMNHATWSLTRFPVSELDHFCSIVDIADHRPIKYLFRSMTGGRALRGRVRVLLVR